MSSKIISLDKSFIEQQRKRLLALQEELSKVMRDEEMSESEITSQSLGEARESEDDAQKLDALEVDGTLVSLSIQRSQLIKRALSKIEDGTYGFSDTSGKAISLERLEAVPEAIYTIEEQSERDAVR